MSDNDNGNETEEEDWPTNEADHMKRHALYELHEAKEATAADERWVHVGAAQAYATLALHAELREMRLSSPPPAWQQPGNVGHGSG